MKDELTSIEKRLRDMGWQIKRREVPAEFPDALSVRYGWLPVEVKSFLSRFDIFQSPSETSWMITMSDVTGESDSAFAWNQWELDSLAAAEDDPKWRSSIRRFWDDHFPFLLSVKSGYAYIAVSIDFTIVRGEEPEFEETQFIAQDFLRFMNLLASNDSRLSSLV